MSLSPCVMAPQAFHYLVDPSGDLQLIVGPWQTSLIVSSKVLMLASPVFRAMFDGAFGEAQFLSSNQKKKLVTAVELPEDNDEAMLLLCSLLHFKGDEGPLAVELLLELAVLVDKYHCASALRYMTPTLLAPFWMRTPIEASRSLVAICYLLRYPAGFARVTRSLIMSESVSYVCLEDLFLIPDEAVGKSCPGTHHPFQAKPASSPELTCRRTLEAMLKMRRIAVRAFIEADVLAAAGKREQDRYSTYHDDCVAALRKGKLWPFPTDASIDAILAKLPCKGLRAIKRNFTSPLPDVARTDYTSGITCSVHGLCLYCISARDEEEYHVWSTACLSAEEEVCAASVKEESRKRRNTSSDEEY